MSPYQAVAVAVRLFAIWLGFYAVRSLLSYAIMVRPETRGLGVSVVFSALIGLLAVALWFFPCSVARTLLSREASEGEKSAAPDLWLAMGCALLGLWILTSAVPTFVLDSYALTYLVDRVDVVEFKRSFVYSLAENAIGLWLVFGAKGFRKLFWWARNAGYGKTP